MITKYLKNEDSSQNNSNPTQESDAIDQESSPKQEDSHVNQGESAKEQRGRAIIEVEGPPYIQKKPGGPVQLNHGCLAALVANEHKLAYLAAEQSFYQYQQNSGLWKKLTETAVLSIIDKEIRSALLLNDMPEAINKLNKSTLQSIVSFLAQRTEKDIEHWGKKNVIHLANGMLDVSQPTPLLLKFASDYQSRNQIPIEYEPDTTCHRCINDLLKACLDSDDIDLLQRYLGSVLLGNNDAQVFLIITGAAAAGKSTLTELIEHIIGERNTYELRTQHLHQRFEIYNYVGKMLLTGKDVPGKFLQEKGAHEIKKLVGGDLISAEKKGSSEQIQLRGNFNLMITANSQLHVNFDGDTQAWKRRLILINWRPPPRDRKRIPNFAKVLLNEEGPGILNWMIQGAVKHLHELEEHGKFILSSAQEMRVEDFLNESDSIRAFVCNCIEEDQTATVTSTQLLSAYEQHCLKMEWDQKSESEFYSASPGMILEYFNRKRSHDIQGARGYRGLKVKA